MAAHPVRKPTSIDSDGERASFRRPRYVVGLAVLFASAPAIAQTITVISPNGSERWQAGTTHSIVWTSTETPGDVWIHLFKGQNEYAYIDWVPLEEGSYSWRISPYVEDGTDYTIRLSWSENGASAEDYSDAPFEIYGGLPRPALTVMSPNGGERWQAGGTQMITWTSANPVGNAYAYLRGPAVDVLIGSAPMANGSLSWSIPPDVKPRYDYRIQLYWSDGSVSVDDYGDAPFEILPPVTVYSFPMDTDPGWSTEGCWEFGVPRGDGSSCGDPPSAHTGMNVYGYSLAGDYANEMQEREGLTTTAMDCSRYRNVWLGYWRWLGVQKSPYDEVSLQVSNDGIVWTDVWINPPRDLCDAQWVRCSFDISDVAALQPSVYVRWTMGPSNETVTHTGWNIDDVEILGVPRDDLVVTPWENYVAAGTEGGPCLPACKTYTLTNTGHAPIAWTAEAQAAWLNIAPTGGSLAPDESVGVQVCLNADADALVPDIYEGILSFRNISSGAAADLSATLTVVPRQAEIELTDSITPADDRDMPFGDVFVGATRTEHLTIRNTHGANNLIISDLRIGRHYVEDFNDGQAQGWREDLDANWQVVSGEYRARTLRADLMTAVYSACEWQDVSATVVMRRSGSPAVAQALLLRSSDDFDATTGSAYVFEIALSGSYAVWKQVDGEWSWLQAWTSSPVIKPGTNTLTAVAQGSRLSLSINGQLVWSGSDYDLTAGKVGLGAYSRPEFESAHYFDDIRVEEPRSVLTQISAQQQWYNARPADGAARDVAPEGEAVEPYPSDAGEGVAPAESCVPLTSNAFDVSLPPNGPPWIVAPGESVMVDIALAPRSVQEYKASLLVVCNDSDTPEVEIRLHGRGIPDWLDVSPAGRYEPKGSPGGPFTPASIEYTLGNTGPVPIDWTAGKTATWLDLSADSGTTAVAGASTVVVSLNHEAYTLPEGQYGDTLTFTNTYSGVVASRPVLLTVRRSPVMWVAPESVAISVPEGGKATVDLTIGNSGDADLLFGTRVRETGRSIAPAGDVLAAATASDGSLVMEYAFDPPAAEQQDGYTLLTVRGTEQYLRPGAPVVPVRPVTLLVPYGKRVSAVRAIPLDLAEPKQKMTLPPAQTPNPLSRPALLQATPPDPMIYGQAAPWPPARYEQAALQSKCGYQLLTINLFPLQYIPVAQQVSYCTRLRLEVDLADAARMSPVGTSAARLRNEVMTQVDNRSTVTTYPDAVPLEATTGPLAQLPGSAYQYVIVTGAALADTPGPWNLDSLRDAKTASGVPATIVTTEWIYANYDGLRPSGSVDNQTRIRNFLIDAYRYWGTRYVLLAGDSVIVPPRMFHVNYDGGVSIPVDSYYGCVDPPECTFDSNANGIYGEPTDGPDGGDVDLCADILVGRAPVADAAEVSNFVRKTLAYAATQGSYLSRVSMVGEYLGFGGVSDYAASCMEQIRLGSCADGYCTAGFAAHGNPDFHEFDISANLYDAPGFRWPASDLLDLMNAGTHVFNHLGHANQTYCMKLNTADLAGLTNADPFFVYSQGCSPGAFDTPDCFAEVVTRMPYGAFAAIMNARYGWGRFNSTDGPSQRFNREFWDAVLAERIFEVGRANEDSKEDNLWGIGDAVIRWCYYELNLFGDPQQELRVVESCEWLSLDPEDGAVVPADSTTLTLSFDTVDKRGQALPPGVYTGNILITGNDAERPAASVPVTMTVTPDGMAVTPAEGFEAGGPVGGPFSPACEMYTLSNTGGSAFDWSAQCDQQWVTISPSGGTLAAGASVNVHVCLGTSAASLAAGTHVGTVRMINSMGGSVRTRAVTLSVSHPCQFTEFFDADDNDLHNQTLTFTPTGAENCYTVCREQASAFPADPSGGTVLVLGDDDYVQVTLADGARVRLYGTDYASFYVGSNGYVTFGAGDSDGTESLADHLAAPRISLLFDDLAPPSGGEVRVRQLPDRAVVTFDGVPCRFAQPSTNSFQVEMFFDGVIRLTWLDIAATGGLAGLSAGQGVPSDFAETDLSQLSGCWVSSDFDHDGDVDGEDFLGFQQCFNGPNRPPKKVGCQHADLDADADVDLADFVDVFRNCFNGPNRPPKCP